MDGHEAGPSGCYQVLVLKSWEHGADLLGWVQVLHFSSCWMLLSAVMWDHWGATSLAESGSSGHHGNLQPVGISLCVPLGLISESCLRNLLDFTLWQLSCDGPSLRWEAGSRGGFPLCNNPLPVWG